MPLSFAINISHKNVTTKYNIGCPTHSRLSNEWEEGCVERNIREIGMKHHPGAPGLALSETWEIRYRERIVVWNVTVPCGS